jgi:hypothetical protein
MSFAAPSLMQHLPAFAEPIGATMDVLSGRLCLAFMYRSKIGYTRAIRVIVVPEPVNQAQVRAW